MEFVVVMKASKSKKIILSDRKKHHLYAIDCIGNYCDKKKFLKNFFMKCENYTFALHLRKIYTFNLTGNC